MIEDLKNINPLISDKILKKIDKILFISHWGIGDFVYAQNYFRELSKRYPNLKMDLWLDDSRGRSFWRRWKTNNKNIIYDWLESCSFFNKIYKDTDSWWELIKIFRKMREQNYQVVVCLVGLRKHKFAKYARLISPSGYIVGAIDIVKKYQFIKKHYFKKLNVGFIDSSKEKNYSSVLYSCSDYYFNVFGLVLSDKDRLPFINIPSKWLTYSKLKFLKWNIKIDDNRNSKIIFINTFAKTKKRCWPTENIINLIENLRKKEEFSNANYIINVLPSEYRYFENKFKNSFLHKIFLFTASKSFFQLPAILNFCDLVISVETSIIHLSAALNIPVISLMRQKNFEWAPYSSKSYVVWTKKREDWVKNIKVNKVIDAVNVFSKMNYQSY